jgi:UDP-N-acetylmuramate--alanine ligase
MVGLARICHERGAIVSGSDAKDSANLESLSELGITIHVGIHPGRVAKPDRIVYSSAIPEDHSERALAPGLRRGEFLAALAKSYQRPVGIAGSHGKTTVTAMLTHILLRCGLRNGYLIGGDVPGIPCAAAGDGDIFISEVDESDQTQAGFHSAEAIVVNADDDHCWSVGGEAALDACFRTFAANAQHLTTWDSPRTRALFADSATATFLSQIPVELRIPQTGAHNRSNAALAIAVAARLGLCDVEATAAMADFPGVDRRLTLRNDWLVEDYAHHPTEVAASLQALRESHPERRLRVVFQPHRNERVRRYCAEFARALSQADTVIVTRAFDAWVDDSGIAQASDIVAACTVSADYLDLPWDALAERIAKSATPGDLFVIMGAGDIAELVPLCEARLGIS